MPLHREARVLTGFSCESPVVTPFQELADEIDKGRRIDAVIFDFAKAFDVIPHGILMQKLDKTGFDRRVVFSVKEFFSG